MQGVFEFLASKGIQRQPTGLEVMVHGTVPTGELLKFLHTSADCRTSACLPAANALPATHAAAFAVCGCTGAGVSSSAAFVCSSALALLGALRVEASPSVRVLFQPLRPCSCCSSCRAGAGVSSSSAFVCSAALAVLAALGQAEHADQRVLT